MSLLDHRYPESFNEEMDVGYRILSFLCMSNTCIHLCWFVVYAQKEEIHAQTLATS